ncbi:MAG: hypothetical protein RJA06_1356, partial [Bacteroidota bacterium]
MPSAMMEHDQNPHEGSANEVPNPDLENATPEIEPIQDELIVLETEANEAVIDAAPADAEAPGAEPEVEILAEAESPSVPAAAADESDEHTDEERESHEDHQADYSELSDAELLAEAARVLREVPIADARVPMLALRNTLLP